MNWLQASILTSVAIKSFERQVLTHPRDIKHPLYLPSMNKQTDVVKMVVNIYYLYPS